MDYDEPKVSLIQTTQSVRLSLTGYNGSSQEAYLKKEEYVAGSFGIETRYPYLDKKVVQEFLNLSPALKNCCYKSESSNYLKNHRFPTLFDEKIGLAFRQGGQRRFRCQLQLRLVL